MENINIIKTKDGKDCILIKKENKEKALGSKYNFINDLNKLMLEIIDKNVNIETTIIILGLYNGEYLKHIKKKLSCKNKVIIFEFNKEIFKKYRNKVPLEFEIYLYNDDFDFNKLNISSVNLKIINFGNYEKLYQYQCKNIYKCLKEIIIAIKIEKNTLKKFSDIWFKCAVNNIKVILKSDKLSSFKDYYKGYPAIIVSAGPSLEKNIKILRKIQNKVVIIAGGRTLKALLNNNIKASFVCVIDPGEGSFNVIKDALDCNVPLVVNDISNFNVIKKYKGNKIFYNNQLNLEFFEYLFGNKEKDFLFSGGSVAHTSTDLARYLGCNEIVFIGQDLAYTNSKRHAGMANISSNNIENKFDLLIDDINGNKIGTSYVLNEFRLKLENYIKEHKNLIKFINATEGGANIIGTEIKKLKAIAEMYKYNKDLKDIEINPYFNNYDKQLVTFKFQQLLTDLKKIQQMSGEVLDLNNKFFKVYKSKNINKYIKSIEIKESKVMKHITSLNAINIVLIPVIEEVLKSSDYIEKKESTYDEKVKLNYLKTQKLYSEIIIKINFCVKVIIDALGENIENL